MSLQVEAFSVVFVSFVSFVSFAWLLVAFADVTVVAAGAAHVAVSIDVCLSLLAA
jgi:hypothetical protein